MLLNREHQIKKTEINWVISAMLNDSLVLILESTNKTKACGFIQLHMEVTVDLVICWFFHVQNRHSILWYGLKELSDVFLEAGRWEKQVCVFLDRFISPTPLAWWIFVFVITRRYRVMMVSPFYFYRMGSFSSYTLISCSFGFYPFDTEVISIESYVWFDSSNL